TGGFPGGNHVRGERLCFGACKQQRQLRRRGRAAHVAQCRRQRIFGTQRARVGNGQHGEAADGKGEGETARAHGTSSARSGDLLFIAPWGAGIDVGSAQFCPVSCAYSIGSRAVRSSGRRRTV